ncbi:MULTISPECIES: histidine kinase [unclassified Pseudomonas]|uniref:histidine kinase n=1 Tax=unclassified Pseudomonas TaxID=196821 RepID=UPI00244C53C4|nr:MULTISPECIES: histidine kinase [unclassified Pseudomonas]MDH0304935.1 histidine kinase [Pseudomonas sp. GD04091]MDH1987582.1 histidine kinase [Pseudomonas sp. GD03689]
MYRLSVLIHQSRPFHQILLHQAFNAQGIYSVRLVEGLADIGLGLRRGLPVDVLVLDHAMPCNSASSLFTQLSSGVSPRALMFVGQAQEGRPDLAGEAQRHGLPVLPDVPWGRLTTALGRALHCLAPRPDRCTCRAIETVMFAAHAR